ncbi:MAG: GNAT family N-acetyltransferase [Terracidiphilus sp.]
MSEMLKTERLLLRRWHEEDRLPFQRINADPRVMEFMPGLLSARESDALIMRIEGHFDRHGFGLFAVEHRTDANLIGFIGLMIPSFQAPFMPAVEIGWRLGAEYWGRGFATEAARAVLHYGFETLALGSVVSFTVPSNVLSRRVMERIGMKHEPREDFDHPGLPNGHPLRRHVLYRIGRI